jgi:hypothetical protein
LEKQPPNKVEEGLQSHAVTADAELSADSKFADKEKEKIFLGGETTSSDNKKSLN